MQKQTVRTIRTCRTVVVLAIVLFGFFGFVKFSEAATIWVNPSGSATSPYDTKDKGVSTISAGLSLLDTGDPGDVLMIANGTYIGDIIVSVSGESGSYKTIKAESDGGVIIDGDNPSWSQTITVTGDYVKIEGIKFINGEQFVCLIDATSTHAYFKNCAFIGADVSNAYAEVFHNNGAYALVEDCWFAGGGRYLVNDGGGKYSVYRRCVGRWDYSSGTQPIGGFMNYHEQAVGGGYNSTYQNCIAIDFNDPIGHDTWLTGAFADKYGHNVHREGCIAINIPSSEQTGSGADPEKVDQRMLGYFDEPSANDGRSGTNTYLNCTAVDCYEGFRQVRSGTTTVDNFMAISSTAGGVGYCAAATPITNSLLSNNGSICDASASYSYVHFENETARGINTTTGSSGLLYPVRTEEDSAIFGTGSGGANKGATILKKIGIDGTHYGDAGWDSITDADLWPFPNEDRIQTEFRTIPAAPIGAIPVNNDSNRGFCAEGNGLYGGPITLTSYIWEYLGNECPADICNYGTSGDVMAPGAPSGLAVN